MELLVLTLLWCGIMLLNTITTMNTHVAAWPQLFFWSTVLTLGAIALQLLAMLASVSWQLLMICAGNLQCAVSYLFSNTVVFFVLSVSIFTLSDEEQKWLHGVLYEPAYAYNENIWVSQLKFILFAGMSVGGVLLVIIIALLLHSAISEDRAKTDQSLDKSDKMDKICNRLQQGVPWGRFLRLHCLSIVFFTDCLTRYLTNVCNDANIIRGTAQSETKNNHCIFTPLDIPALSDGSSPSSQALEYSAFVILNFLCDIMVQQRFCMLASHIATSENYTARSSNRNFKSTSAMQVYSPLQLGLPQKQSVYIIAATRLVQFAVLLILLFAYTEQRFAFITEYLVLLIVLVLLSSIYTDCRDYMALYNPVDTKKTTMLRKPSGVDFSDVLPENLTSLSSTNALAFRYDVRDRGHIPGSVFMRPRLGLKTE